MILSSRTCFGISYIIVMHGMLKQVQHDKSEMFYNLQLFFRHINIEDP